MRRTLADVAEMLEPPEFEHERAAQTQSPSPMPRNDSEPPFLVDAEVPDWGLSAGE